MLFARILFNCSVDHGLAHWLPQVLVFLLFMLDFKLGLLIHDLNWLVVLDKPFVSHSCQCSLRGNSDLSVVRIHKPKQFLQVDVLEQLLRLLFVIKIHFSVVFSP